MATLGGLIQSVLLAELLIRLAVGTVAQRLEQGTHNPLVLGSNPGGPISALLIIDHQAVSFSVPIRIICPSDHPSAAL